ncbi:hypothetical protein [Thiomicrorhabdus sp. 6S3-12]|uniref:hypothetical protein n=1 Tax=Thiomicrorhabdus sp. 6S3-12 TaxID=2819681 RepID=UPI001AAD6E64|nr:hypothetical protein [Thiomicrorhabdus sp. 6S3-12]MBO1924723.1 hypothetical protein [Thiomicrorhabdus sp. 6S3-12]
MDITATISTALGSIKTATDIAKVLKESDSSLEKAELKLKLAEIISALADVKMEMSDIQQLVHSKDDEINALKKALSTEENLSWEHPYYWHIADNGKEGPFCQQCYDKNKELIRLQGNGEGYWECKTCKNSYTDDNYSPYIGTASYHSPFDEF